MPKPVLKPGQSVKEKETNYLVKAANKRSLEKATIMAEQLKEIRKEETPAMLFRAPHLEKSNKKRPEPSN